MGRWLKTIENIPRTAQTKLTEPISVGSVSTTSGHFYKNITGKIVLGDFVRLCCDGLPVETQQVIDNLLSSIDEQDIMDGKTPIESLRLHIDLWITAGKPHYSGKKTGIKKYE